MSLFISVFILIEPNPYCDSFGNERFRCLMRFFAFTSSWIGLGTVLESFLIAAAIFVGLNFRRATKASRHLK